jgi:hypothetical protein
MLVSLNLQNSLHAEKQVQYLQSQLAARLKKWADSQVIEFIDPWPCAKQKESWKWRDIFIGKRSDEKWNEALWKARKSTWFYRRLIPFILSLFWILSGIALLLRIIRLSL